MGRTSKGLDLVFSTHLRTHEEGKVLNSQIQQTGSQPKEGHLNQEKTQQLPASETEAET